MEKYLLKPAHYKKEVIDVTVKLIFILLALIVFKFFPNYLTDIFCCSISKYCMISKLV